MNFERWFLKGREKANDRVAPRAGLGSDAGPGPEIEDALRNFRQSVHTWSDAAFQRSRLVEVAPRRGGWRPAAAWALGSVLMAGGVGGGFLEYQHRQELARIAAAREAQRQRQLQEDQARLAEQELAQVDHDISRQVPDALEPLARLMTADDNQ